MFVPVVDSENRPLMPTTPSRARRWIKSGKATPFWKKGVFCLRLNVALKSANCQPIAVGIDPGSKREAFTVKSQSHTYLNIQTHAVDWVKDHIEVRRNMRRARRFRNTPCRQNRANRVVNKNRIPPSTKARWQWKLRIANWLALMFPVSAFVVEDIKARITLAVGHCLQQRKTHTAKQLACTVWILVSDCAKTQCLRIASFCLTTRGARAN
jgi:hypothetical protein